MSSQHWIETFQKCQAFWIHDNNPRRPHALLTSGLHSNGFFNSSPVTKNPMLLESMISDLAFVEMPKQCPGLVDMNALAQRKNGGVWVIGSAMGAVTIAFELARLIKGWAGFTEPMVDASGKCMVLKRFALGPADFALVVEDVITTGGTTMRTLEAISETGAEIAPIILTLVNRSGLKEIMGRKIAALIDNEMPTWAADNCPLCRAGSEAIRPKGNWQRLTANY